MINQALTYMERKSKEGLVERIRISTSRCRDGMPFSLEDPDSLYETMVFGDNPYQPRDDLSIFSTRGCLMSPIHLATIRELRNQGYAPVRHSIVTSEGQRDIDVKYHEMQEGRQPLQHTKELVTQDIPHGILLSERIVIEKTYILDLLAKLVNFYQVLEHDRTMLKELDRLEKRVPLSLPPYMFKGVASSDGSVARNDLQSLTSYNPTTLSEN